MKCEHVEDIGQQDVWYMSAWDAMTLDWYQGVCGDSVETYEVDSTLEGFKLILFRVRASGTGIL